MNGVSINYPVAPTSWVCDRIYGLSLGLESVGAAAAMSSQPRLGVTAGLLGVGVRVLENTACKGLDYWDTLWNSPQALILDVVQVAVIIGHSYTRNKCQGSLDFHNKQIKDIGSELTILQKTSAKLSHIDVAKVAGEHRRALRQVKRAAEASNALYDKAMAAKAALVSQIAGHKASVSFTETAYSIFAKIAKPLNSMGISLVRGSEYRAVCQKQVNKVVDYILVLSSKYNITYDPQNLDFQDIWTQAGEGIDVRLSIFQSMINSFIDGLELARENPTDTDARKLLMTSMIAFSSLIEDAFGTSSVQEFEKMVIAGNFRGAEPESDKKAPLLDLVEVQRTILQELSPADEVLLLIAAYLNNFEQLPAYLLNAYFQMKHVTVLLSSANKGERQKGIKAIEAFLQTLKQHSEFFDAFRNNLKGFDSKIKGLDL